MKQRKQRTIKRLKAIADRIGMPYRQNDCKHTLEQNILSFLAFPKLWKSIEGIKK